MIEPKFSVTKEGDIRFGLGAVKNVGENSGYKEYPCAPSPNRYAGRAYFLAS